MGDKMSKSANSLPRCTHTNLSYDVSPHAAEVGFSRVTAQQRLAATTPRGSTNSVANLRAESPTTFPAPLVLPGDDLSSDPKSPPQSLRSWIREKERNEVTPQRRTVYLAAAPEIDSEVSFISKWAQPKKKSAPTKIERPKITDVLSYLQAFYHGLPVKMLLPLSLRFTPVESDEYSLGLETNSSGCIGIQTRKTPKEYADFTHQLNLNDLLDAAIAALPEDAYALLMLVNHDIYEDDDDEFACGRAYGGSRVAVVSTARYNPALDHHACIERAHAWPASHCSRYIQTCCKKSNPGGDGKMDINYAGSVGESSLSGASKPIQDAIVAHDALPDLEASPSAAALQGLWLGRICRTAGHELGHCFGMDHCVYYACSMQGTATIIEDARQPPYLCPIDLSKMIKATGAKPKERYQALLKFCDLHKHTHLFAAFGSWIRARLVEIDEGIVDTPRDVIVID